MSDTRLHIALGVVAIAIYWLGMESSGLRTQLRKQAKMHSDLERHYLKEIHTVYALKTRLDIVDGPRNIYVKCKDCENVNEITIEYPKAERHG